MRHYDCATMASTVKGLLAADKGILAADESFPKIAKRFAAITDVPKVVEATVRCLLRSVPAAIPGIVFLSGGQNDEAATQRLNAICRVNDVPWKLSFSFERALQAPSLKIWKGSQDNVAAAQAALHHRAKCNGLAVQGKYSEQLESANT